MKPNEAAFPVHEFTYDASRGFPVRNGWRMGGLSCKGYRSVRIGGVRVQEHRLVWRLVKGEWPQGQLDHRNRDRSDNRIENLRHCTHSQNNFNRVSWNNTSGEKNILRNRQLNCWQIKIKAGGILIHRVASSYPSAVCAARLIRRILHGEFGFEAGRVAA